MRPAMWSVLVVHRLTRGVTLDMATSYEIEACNSTSSTSLLLGGGQREDGREDGAMAASRATAAYSAHCSAISHMLRRTWTRILLSCLAGLAVAAGLFATDGLAGVSSTASYVAWSGYILGTFTSGSSSPYYTPSPSQRPPALSSIPASLKRITLVSIWAGSSDKQPSYLNNFFRSAVLNAQVADLLVIHVTNDASKCLSEVREDGINRDSAAWDWQNGGNIRVVCQSRETHLAEEADFLCSEQGWNCDDKTYKQVLRRLHDRADEVNVDWKPMRGEMYKKYFVHPENPIWGWCDMDMHLGRLEHLPFPLISTVSMLGLSVFSPALLYLDGQMSIFNMAAPGFIGSWKKYTTLESAKAFINPADASDGGYPGGGIDETWLSAAYLRDGQGYAGTGLSWALIPDVHGQDLFIPGRKFVISGIDVLEVDSRLNRKEIEAILKDAREMPVDEYAGWSEEAEIVQTQMSFGEDCIDAWFDKSLALTLGDQFTQVDSVRRATILRIASDPPNALSMRLEPDRRPRRWQRKLFMHYQELKRQNWWWKLPPWFIGDNGEVMEFDWKSQYIWKPGEEREKNLWSNLNERLKEKKDGSAGHVLEADPKKLQGFG